MKELKGDLLTLKKGFICHQVNVNGVMGAGIALQIKKKWPIVFERYKKLCNENIKNPSKLLGRIQEVRINDDLYILNLFGQFLGRASSFGPYRPTRYDAVADAFEELWHSNRVRSGSLLYIPKNMGCALGGGDWNIYLAIVTQYLPDVNIVDFEPGKDIYDPDDLADFKEHGMSIMI